MTPLEDARRFQAPIVACESPTVKDCYVPIHLDTWIEMHGPSTLQEVWGVWIAGLDLGMWSCRQAQQSSDQPRG